MINTILWILFLHLIADFFLQSNWMALGKSKSALPLLAHVGMYYLVFVIGTMSIQYALINAGIHLIVDFITSRVNSKLYAFDDKHWFFCGIGVDQFIHSVCLILTLGLM